MLLYTPMPIPNSLWKQVWIFSILVLLGIGTSFSQTTISGQVTGSDGEGLAGATIQVRGTQTGIFTDEKGQYNLTVPNNESVLVISFIGYETQEITVGNRSTVNISLVSIGLNVDEVVITALGLERSKKAITYSAQNVRSQDMKEARPLNVVNGLSGKVAGASVARSGAGVGGASKLIIRGNRSISGSSQPIYIVDGVPLGQDISNISPDDIETITVLKGANAAALYGARANNGVVVVTTKRGNGGESFSVDLNTTFMASEAIYLNSWQNEYGQGTGGEYSPNANRSWGPKLDGTSKAHWSNDPSWSGMSTYQAYPNNKTTDFFQTGRNLATNLGITSNTANSSSYFSYTFTDAAGIVPGNKLNSHNINVRVNTKVHDRLTLDSKVNYIRQNINYELDQGESYANPIRAAYKMPSNINPADAQIFEFTDPSGVIKQHYWLPGNNAPMNPYWNLNRLTNDVLNERVIGLISLKYDFTDELSLLVRSALDRFNRTRVNRWANDSYIIAQNGRYFSNDTKGFEWNSDFLLNYNNTFGSDLNVDVSFGGNLRQTEFRGINGNPNGNSTLNVPNLFAFSNTGTQSVSESFNQKEVQSLYGFATIGWKDAIFLDLTARNDWSSTLKPGNWSYLYPSAGLTVVISDLMESTPDWLTLAKLRGSYAQVGNDTDPYRTARLASIGGGGTGGFLQLSTTIPVDNLLPEETTSLEFGADLRFFQNRLGIDLTYYQSNSTDQLFAIAVPVASGASSVFLNGADIENKGIELVLNVRPISTREFQWDINFNFARNRSTVIELAEGLDQLNIGGASFLRQFRLIAGRPWGDVYSKGFERDDQGRVIVEANGVPRTTSGLDVQVSNFNPDWLGGIRNTFSFKNLTLSFLIDIRQGGTVVSNTDAIMFADGLTVETLEGREGGLVFGDNFFPDEIAVQEDGTPNTVATTSEAMWNQLGGRNAPVGEAFIRDASNSRLREVVLGYSIPSTALGKSPFSGIKISAVGRNLFFFSNAAGNIDPEIIVGTGINADGTEAFGPPTMREYGVNLKLSF
ncbi:MAG: SusC/RagA family TonB-linked outer membrane protein [Bacteroidota bacterium]